MMMNASRICTLVSFWLASTAASLAQNVVTAGPMDVGRYLILQKAAQNKANGFWAEVAYQEYNNGLLEGLFDKEGYEFCLPQQLKVGAVRDVFRQMTVEIEIAARNAKPTDFVSSVAIAHLKQKYPCQR